MKAAGAAAKEVEVVPVPDLKEKVNGGDANGTDDKQDTDATAKLD